MVCLVCRAEGGYRQIYSSSYAVSLLRDHNPVDGSGGRPQKGKEAIDSKLFSRVSSIAAVNRH